MRRHCTASWVCTSCVEGLGFCLFIETLKDDTVSDYLFDPPAIQSLAVRGEAKRFPIHRLFFVGRNYLAHAEEMGNPIDKATMRPFYFTKTPQALTPSGATVPYPPGTKNFHYEMELVVAIGKPGFRISAANAHEHIYGYAAGLDMTRRDLQLVAREQGRPWDLGKDVEHSAVCTDIMPMPGQVLSDADISLAVNGVTKQHSNVSKLIWDIREIIEDLSEFYHLQAGDLIYTGTPEGVGPVVAGDQITGQVQGVGEIALTLGPAE